MPRVTFAIIGAGRMGLMHLNAATKLGFNVKAVHDTNLVSLQKIPRENYSADTELILDLEDFFSIGTVDLLAIATTSPSHSGLIEAAIANGQKRIVCEKPLATSTQELNRISALATSNSVDIGVNHQMRFLQQYTSIKTHQRDFGLGSLCSMSVSGANFGLGMNATHYIEAFCWLVGQDIDVVSGHLEKESTPNRRGSQFVDYAGYIVARSKEGAVLFLDFQEKASHQIIVVYNFEFGKVTCNELMGTFTIDCRFSESRNEPSNRYGLANLHEEKTFEPLDLVDSTALLYTKILNGEDYPTHFDGARTVRVALAALYSSKMNGVPISPLDPALDGLERLFWP